MPRRERRRRARRDHFDRLFTRIVKGAEEHRERTFNTWPFAPWVDIPGIEPPTKFETLERPPDDDESR